MSADNWAVCPRCLRSAKRAKDALQARITNEYGKIPIPAWDALRAEYDQPIDEEALSTFREDHEFWLTQDGEWGGSYKGGCAVCGLSHEWKQSVQLLGSDS